MNNITYTIKGTVLSPLHIGCGETYNIFDYHIHDRDLHRIDYIKLINSLSEHDKFKFSSLMDGNDRIAFLKFRAEKFNPDEHSIAKIKAHSSLVSKYTTALNQNRLNTRVVGTLNIERFIRLSNETPYIPGSSIKGAIRTAFFDYLIEHKAPESLLSSFNNDRKGIFIEKKLTSNRERQDRNTTYIDPFSLVKITDGYFTKTKQKIEALDTEYDSFIETISPASEFNFNVTIDYVKSNINRPNNCIFVFEDYFKKHFIASLLSSSKFFSLRLLNNDVRIIGNDKLQSLVKYLKKSNDKNIYSMIKLGRFTGFDSKTFFQFHNVRNRRGAPYRNQSEPKLRIVTKSKEPLGWVFLEIINKEDHGKNLQ